MPHSKLSNFFLQFDFMRSWHRTESNTATAALNKYFDPASRRTQNAATMLQQAQQNMKGAELPRLDETLSALATARSMAASTRSLDHRALRLIHVASSKAPSAPMKCANTSPRGSCSPRGKACTRTQSASVRTAVALGLTAHLRS